jgi:PKD repeat protein
MKKFYTFLLALFGLSAGVFGQSTPLYMGYYYNSEISIIDTATFMETGTLSMTSDAGTVNGCYGLSLDAATGDMYILYQTDAGSATSRRLGIIDLGTGAISDIGNIGNMNDIGFVNGQLYATTGSYVGQAFYEVDKSDASSTMLLAPSSDNESCGLIHNYYNGNVYFIDEDHFTLIDLETNTETPAVGFPSFPEECNSIVMITENTALVGNYDELYLFEFDSFTFTYIMDGVDNIHGMAFGQYPLVVAIDGPSTYCSTDASTLSTTETGATYQWFKDGVEIDGATDATLTPIESGAYSCEVDGELTKNEISVEVIPAPVVSFTATPNPVYLGDDPTGTVAFNNTTPIGDEFFWDFDNGFNTSVENPSFPFTEAGMYDVTLMVTDSETGCTGEATVTVEVVAGVGIEESLAAQFEVFPTLTNDFVTINYAGVESNLVGNIVDLNGRVVASTNIKASGSSQVDLSALENGVYLLRIASNDAEVAVFRIVKQ